MIRIAADQIGWKNTSEQQMFNDQKIAASEKLQQHQEGKEYNDSTDKL